MPEIDRAWYCLRSQPSRQNVAAAHLRSFGIEVFNPQLRVRRATRRGVVERPEPLFPNYLFARFLYATNHRRVRYAFGVSHLVCVAGQPREVPGPELDRLREEWGPSEALTIVPQLVPGTRVSLSGPIFHGVEAEVLCLLPARRRVKVLLDFLGGPAPVEVAAEELAVVMAHPLAAM